MKKILSLLISLIMLVAFCFTFIACNDETETEYTVTFRVDNAVYREIKFAEGEKIRFPEDPTKGSYIFSGWYRGNVQWVEGKNEVTSDVVLVAKWKTATGPSTEDKGQTTYKLTVADFDSQMGTVMRSPQKNNYAVNEKVTLTVTASSGYEIQSIVINDVDYTDSLRGESTEFTTASKEVTITSATLVEVKFQEYGVWANPDYVYKLSTSKFDTNKGSVTVFPDRARYAEGEEVTFTVTINDGSMVKIFDVNGVSKRADLALTDNAYTYTLTITENTAMNIVFDDDLTKIYTATVSNYDAVVARKGKVLVDFYGTTCSPCQQLAALFERYTEAIAANDAAAIAADVKIVKVNVSSNTSIQTSSPQYRIFQRYETLSNGGLPFMVMLEDGELVGYMNGMYDDYDWLLGWMTNPTMNI
ncbi:MAG: InlB B-repeat-containing protein [Clostridia bacterium]|nr:InlB B-repeat-containing protein [Clostridia bacterium]